jgi:hypothetical protein
MYNFISKVRSDLALFMVIFTQLMATGQFCLPAPNPSKVLLVLNNSMYAEYVLLGCDVL